MANCICLTRFIYVPLYFFSMLLDVLFVSLQLDCCGWENPRKEFAANNEWIDDTCYQDAGQGNSGVLARFDDQSIPKKMKNVRYNM